MPVVLDQAEVRVLGCLMEKEASTPEYYPLTLNALLNACNQKSNRDPVVSYTEDVVEQAVEALREKGLAVRISGREMRVPKYAHRLTEVFNFGRRESAVLCVLLLRGAQTPGEIRGRTDRMYQFEDLAGVEGSLTRLMEWQPNPLVMRLPRLPGSREPRYAHLLAGEPETPREAPAEPLPPAGLALPNLLELQETVHSLQREVAELRARLAQLSAKQEP